NRIPQIHNEFGNSTLTRMSLALQSKRDWSGVSGRILEPPPKARGNGARLCAEHQPQRHGEATRFGIIRRLWASALAAAGPSDTAAVRRWFQDAPAPCCRAGICLLGQSRWCTHAASLRNKR